MIEIRHANDRDRAALVRLAERDSAGVPAAPLLLAEEDGTLRAALSLTSGEAIADPFAPTERLIATLTAYAAPARTGARRIPTRLAPALLRL